MPGLNTTRWSIPVLLILLASLAAVPARADEGDDEPTAHTAASLRATLLYQDYAADAAMGRGLLNGQRSVPLAFGLSAVAPGLGQAYNRQWIKAAVAVAAEALLIVGYTTWHGRGVDGRDAYQAYAQAYWSPVRYAQWLNEYKVFLETEFGTPISGAFITLTPDLQGVDFSNAESWTSAQRSAVRSLFDQIRALETNVYHPETGASFSHKLPYFGEQQYYELVGKYFQFAPGWADYRFFVDENGNATWIDEDGNFIASIDPEMTGPGGTKPNVSARFFEYAQDHGQANDYLRRASRLSVLFIANHFLAAVDAALFARLHNNRLKASLAVGYDALGELQPVATLTVAF